MDNMLYYIIIYIFVIELKEALRIRIINKLYKIDDFIKKSS